MAFKQAEVERLLVATGRRCCICGKLHRAQVHHIVPLEQGGSDDIENGIPLCPNCHDEVHTGYSPGRTTRVYSAEELRRHRERAIERVKHQQQWAPGSPEWEHDRALVLFYAQCLDRPAFRTHFHNELSFSDFDRAIEDTLLALNTGYWRTREGVVIDRSQGKAHLVNQNWRDRLDRIAEIIEEIRTRFRQALRLDEMLFRWSYPPASPHGSITGGSLPRGSRARPMDGRPAERGDRADELDPPRAEPSRAADLDVIRSHRSPMSCSSRGYLASARAAARNHIDWVQPDTGIGEAESSLAVGLFLQHRGLLSQRGEGRIPLLGRLVDKEEEKKEGLLHADKKVAVEGSLFRDVAIIGMYGGIAQVLQNREEVGLEVPGPRRARIGCRAQAARALGRASPADTLARTAGARGRRGTWPRRRYEHRPIRRVALGPGRRRRSRGCAASSILRVGWAGRPSRVLLVLDRPRP